MNLISGSVASRKNNGLVYPGMTATTNDHSIQAISYCAKNPSQKLPPEQARVVRNQQRTKNSIHLNTEEEDEDDDVFEKVMFCEISLFFFFLLKEKKS